MVAIVETKHFPMMRLLFWNKLKKTTSSTDIPATVLELMNNFMSYIVLHSPSGILGGDGDGTWSQISHLIARLGEI